MSRIGKQPVVVPKGVDVTINGLDVKVKGPKGLLERTFHPAVKLVREGDNIEVSLVEDIKSNSRFHGLSRSLLNNMVVGVSSGYTKGLTLVGVGYRAQLKGKDLTLSLGYSHPIEFPAPEGIEFQVEKQTALSVSGSDKELVGRVAAKIRGFRPPEPYHGKGVRYTDEHIATKVGKASGKK